MTNKALLGLVGGGSVAAGLGTGFGVGFNTQPFYINEDIINTFYSNLISNAEYEIAEYKKMSEDNKKAFLEAYKNDVCKIANKTDETYNSEEARERAKKDKALCDETNGNFDTHKPKWLDHFKNYAEDLKKEWAEFKKHVYDPKPHTTSE